MKTLLLLLALLALCFTVTGCEDDDDNSTPLVWLVE
jgi:hypothetical protein